jgi:hypothetical protein
MDNVGKALVVGGIALLFSGLIFLLPVRVRASRSMSGAPVEEPLEQDAPNGGWELVEKQLNETRRSRGELDP